MEKQSHNRVRLARNTGLVYLVVVITGMFSLAYVPKQLVDWESAETTLQNLLAEEALFRHGILAGILCYVAFTLLPLLFYRMLGSIDEWYAKMMAVFALLSVPISFVNLQHKLRILNHLKSVRENPETFGELSKKVLEQLQHYNEGILVAMVFWGLWLLPLGYLVFRSGFLPKILGILLILGCMGYMVNLLGYLLLPSYVQMGFSGLIGMVPAVAEIGTCIWLLLVGFKIIPLRL